MKAQYLNNSEIIILNAIADQNVFVGGDGVLNARAMLDKEIYEEPSYMRIHSTIYSNTLASTLTLEQIHNLSSQQKEKINVQVYNLVGQIEYKGTLKSWVIDPKSRSNEFHIIKYFNLYEYLGCEKTLKLN